MGNGQPTQAQQEYAFKLHAAARSVSGLTFVAFMSPYLTKAAKLHAEADGTIYWMGIPLSAASYSAAYSFVSAFLVAVIAPTFGAAVDHTPYRKKAFIGINCLSILSCWLCILLLIQDAWWLGGVLAVMLTLTYELCLVLLYAYLPTITTTIASRTKLSSQTVVYGNGAQLATVIIFTVISVFIGVPTPRLVDPTFSNFSVEKAFDASSTWEIVASSNQSVISLSKDVDNGLLLKAMEPIGLRQYFQIGSGKGFESTEFRITFELKATGTFTDSSALQQAQVNLLVDGDVFASNGAMIPANEYTMMYVQAKTPDEMTSFAVELILPGCANDDCSFAVKSAELVGSPQRLAPIFVGVAGLIWCVLAVIVFKNLASPPQGRAIPPGYNAVTAGLKQLYKTATVTLRNRPSHLQYLLAISLYSAGSGAAVALVSVFLSEILKMSASAVGAALLLAQVCGIFGALIFYLIGKKIGFLRSLALCVTIIDILIFMVFLFLNGEKSAPLAYPLLASVGLCLGGSTATIRGVWASAIPFGQEAEFMGVLNFSFQVLSWSGSLTFAIVVEATGSPKVGMLSLCGFLTAAAILLITNDEKKLTAMSAAVPTDELELDLQKGTATPVSPEEVSPRSVTFPAIVLAGDETLEDLDFSEPASPVTSDTRLVALPVTSTATTK